MKDKKILDKNILMKKVLDFKTLSSLSKDMLLFQPVVVLVVTALYVITNKATILECITGESIVVVPSILFWATVHPISKKKLKKYKCELENLEKQEADNERKELGLEKTEEKDISLSNEKEKSTEEKFEIKKETFHQTYVDNDGFNTIMISSCDPDPSIEEFIEKGQVKKLTKKEKNYEK